MLRGKKFLLTVIWLNCQAIIRRPVTAEGKFNTGPGHVGFVVEKMALEKGFWKKLLFPLSLVIIIPSLHIHVDLYADIPQSQTVESWRIKKKCPVTVKSAE
jgi:hypothetical protein